MNLNTVFPHVFCKRLANVDLPQLNSNQHELSGVAKLKEYFRYERTEGTLKWHYFSDGIDPIQETGGFTFYDSRANTPRSAEWKFYYKGNFLSNAEAGDWFFLVQDSAGQLSALIIEQDSSFLRAAKALFDIHEDRDLFELIEQDTLSQRSLGFLQRKILEELQLESVIPIQQSDEELILNKFGKDFPKTKEMSDFARKQADVDPDKIDEALICWLNREWELFSALEHVIVGEKVKSGFQDVEEFISYSLSVTNRRKARMGYALENHLAELFNLNGLSYSWGMNTEGKKTPDFIFPGIAQYHDNTFDGTLLNMLGVKSTCKDRWRQILNEAGRILEKHLCTLETGISVQQTGEMEKARITLVVPASIHETFTSEQLSKIMSVTEFVGYVSRKQNK